MLASLALTAFLTGVTEPIEFTFMFLAPVLFALHAILTGAAMALMDALHIKLGFSFSAGVFDYVLNFKLASRPLWLLPVGLAYFALYYGLFRFFIQRFDLKTPGARTRRSPRRSRWRGRRGAAFVAALGGAGNLASIDACTTRLRLVVHDQGAIDEPGLKALGARGFIRPSARDLQVVVGPIADEVAREMRDSLGGLTLQAAAPVAPAQAAQPVRKLDAAPLLAALGGPSNLKAVTTCSSRLRLIVADIAAIDEAALRRLGSRGLVRPGNASLHVILGPDAEALAEALRNLVAVS